MRNVKLFPNTPCTDKLVQSLSPSSSVGLQGTAAAPGGCPVSHFCGGEAGGCGDTLHPACGLLAGRQKANLHLQQPRRVPVPVLPSPALCLCPNNPGCSQILPIYVHPPAAALSFL